MWYMFIGTTHIPGVYTISILRTTFKHSKVRLYKHTHTFILINIHLKIKYLVTPCFNAKWDSSINKLWRSTKQKSYKELSRENNLDPHYRNLTHWHGDRRNLAH